ncbi:MAG: hypothetical protein V3V97_02225 [Hyphomicrobiaceae bacterium]
MMVVVALVGYSTFLDRTYGAFFVLFLIYFVFSFGFVWSCLASLFPPAKGKRLAVFLAWLIETLIRTAKIFAIVSVAALIGVLLSELLGLQRVSIATAVTDAMSSFAPAIDFWLSKLLGALHVSFGNLLAAILLALVDHHTACLSYSAALQLSLSPLTL